MDRIDEMPALAIVATGVLVVDAPTPLQVVWLLALAGVLIVVRRVHPLDRRGGDGGGGQRLPQPPTRAT